MKRLVINWKIFECTTGEAKNQFFYLKKFSEKIFSNNALDKKILARGGFEPGSIDLNTATLTTRPRELGYQKGRVVVIWIKDVVRYSLKKLLFLPFFFKHFIQWKGWWLIEKYLSDVKLVIYKENMKKYIFPLLIEWNAVPLWKMGSTI